MLDEIEAHEIKLFLPSNVVRNIDETAKVYLRRLLSIARSHLQMTEEELSEHYDYLVRRYRSEIIDVLNNELLAQFNNIKSTMTNDEAASILLSGRVESDKLANIKGEVFFTWYILIENPFEYLFCTCDKGHFK